MERKKTGVRCSVRFCKNKAAEKNISFFNYPNDVERRAIWIKNCQTQHIVSLDSRKQCSARVCGDHFEMKMFLRQSTRNRLVFNAIPTVFNNYILDQRKKSTIYSELITDNDEDIQIDDSFLENVNFSPASSLCSMPCGSSDSTKDFSVQLPCHLSDNTLNKFRSKAEIQTEKQKLKQLENTVINLSQQLIKYESIDHVLRLCEIHLSSDLIDLVKSHLI